MLASNDLPKSISIKDKTEQSQKEFRQPRRVLCVDDDPDTRVMLGMILEPIGLEVVFAENGSQMLEAWRKSRIDLIILDVMMPIMDGLEACKRIRNVSDVPIIFLSAKGEEDDVVVGFELGANDYVLKPFRPKELVARIRAMLLRGEEKERIQKQLAFDKLVLDMDAQRVTSQGMVIEVSPLEFRLLQYMMQNIGVVISKEDLLKYVWGYVDIAGDMNLIEAAVRRLRSKLELDPSHPQYIKTVWGAGYRFGD
jgi:DNA-binding response OmpR family regulator